MENSKATPRQLWALYCITKKDYRNSNLTKEEAAKLISKLGSPDYKKVKKKTLSEELLDYLTENFDKIFTWFSFGVKVETHKKAHKIRAIGV